MSSTDTSLGVINSMTEAYLESLKDSSGKVASLANQLIMTPDNENGSSGGGGISLSDVYPVGSIYLSIDNTSPAGLFGGTWTEIASGKSLWTTSTSSADAGNTISAGLPNIKGTMTSILGDYGSGSNAFSSSQTSTLHTGGSTNSWNIFTLNFNANSYNSIYNDNTTTVQPPAYKVYAWRRIA